MMVFEVEGTAHNLSRRAEDLERKLTQKHVERHNMGVSPLPCLDIHKCKRSSDENSHSRG